MKGPDYNDLVGGGAVLGLGLFIAIYSLVQMRQGTLAEIGPGLLPSAMGILLAFLGLLIVIPALFRSGTLPSMDLRVLVAVSLAILAYAGLITNMGMVPATIALVAISSRADSSLTIRQMLFLATGLCVLSVLIFRVALGMQVLIFNWPW